MITNTTTPKVNYVNNKDLLIEIHHSKRSYCSFLNPEIDHQYDLILPSVSKINRNTIAEAKRQRADRLKKQEQIIIDPKKIPISDLVFRVTSWEHIPLAPPKESKTKTKKIQYTDVFDFSEIESNDEETLDLEIDPESRKHTVLNFPPFCHYRLDEDKNPYLVGKSHWRGDFETGEFCMTHGRITHKLALMFMKLCERYASRINWRLYSYNDEMRSQALLQLTESGLKFDESKGKNPFAYYTSCITNSFTKILNVEKRVQNIRDDILEINGMNPSWTRQNAGQFEAQASRHYET